jgi:hypothetical protein
MPDVAVPLVSLRRERVLLFQRIQHALAAFVLLMDGGQGLLEEPHGPSLILALGEIVSSVLVIGSVGRAARQQFRAIAPAHAQAHAHGVDWIDIFLSGMLATEAIAHYQHTGHVRRPTVLLAVVMLALGLLHGRVSDFHARRRALRVTDAGITLGGRFFTRFTAAWSEIASIDVGDRHATIVTRAGRTRRINVTDLSNAAVVSKVLNESRARLNPTPEPKQCQP